MTFRYAAEQEKPAQHRNNIDTATNERCTSLALVSSHISFARVNAVPSTCDEGGPLARGDGQPGDTRMPTLRDQILALHAAIDSGDTPQCLAAITHICEIPYHLNRTMDNGLTQQQAGEAITHLAFYVGWPNAFSAMPVAKEVFEKRARPAQ
jgi:hypothetical protein